MKKLWKRVAAVIVMAALLISLTGCGMTVRIYGKPLDSLSDIDHGYGIIYLTQIMDAFRADDLETVNDMGYHAGLEDAETFEGLFEEWHELSSVYGQPESIFISEGYQYGNEKAYIGEMEMENGGSLMLALLFTSNDELALADLYETEKGFWSRISVPESVAEEEITLGEGTDFPLSAKITYPKDMEEGEKLPAVVLVGGDGGNTMDMRSGSVRPYQDIAWGLAEKGIVTIRFDKRTYTYSDLESAEEAPAEVFTIDWEYAEDALLAAEALLGKPFVDANRIYYFGHSQGGVVGSRIQEKAVSAKINGFENGFAGFILASTSPRPWYDVIYDQYIRYGLIDRQSDEIYYLVQKIGMERDYVKEGDYLKVKEEKLTKEFALTRPAAFWKDYFSYDYVDGYRKLAESGAPLLILQGSADYQITVEDDYAVWEATISSWNTSSVTMKEFDGLNHLLTPSQGIFAGHYKEYDRPGRVPQEVIDEIAAWIR